MLPWDVTEGKSKEKLVKLITGIASGVRCMKIPRMA